MQANCNWGIFFEQATFGNVTYLNWLIDGFLTTAALFICAWIVAFIAGSFFGILRTLPSKFFRSVGATYVAIFRNIPLIVQFFIWYLPPVGAVCLQAHASVNRYGLAFWLFLAGSATRPLPWAPPCPRPTATCCFPMPTALSYPL